MLPGAIGGLMYSARAQLPPTTDPNAMVKPRYLGSARGQMVKPRYIGNARAQDVPATAPLPPSSRYATPAQTGPPPLNPASPTPSDPGDPAKLYAPPPAPANEAASPAASLAESPLPPSLPINLATALQLAGVNPLDIAAATAQVKEALGLLLQAQALKIPNLNAGADYLRHDGVQQNIFTGNNFIKGRQSLFAGGGVSLSVGLTDAIFAPLAAKRVVASREADLQTARNNALLSVAQAYFQVQQARGVLVGVDATIVRARRLVELARGLAPSLIAPLEINRTEAELQSLLQTRELAIQDWRVASAGLAEILLLDPGTLLDPIEPPFLQITLIPANQTADELIPLALNNRPEIASRKELLDAAHELLRRERNRPFLPNLYVLNPATGNGLLTAGNQSSGPNGSLGSNGGNLQIELAAVWQLQGAGVGNVGLIRQRKADQDLATVELTRSLFRVKSEVAQALARLQSAQARIPQTQEGLRQAIESADKNFIGLRETTRPAGELLRLVVRPQEVVAALIALELAFEQYSAAVNQYNSAQFDLYRALGQPAQWVTAHPDKVQQ
jgi:outer membrane protein TolC